jgi:hypothetical protein
MTPIINKHISINVLNSNISLNNLDLNQILIFDDFKILGGQSIYT